MTLDDNGPPLLEVEERIKRSDIFCRFKRRGEIVEKQTGLKQGIFEDLALTVDLLEVGLDGFLFGPEREVVFSYTIRV